jgi:hypothetical protein
MAPLYVTHWAQVQDFSAKVINVASVDLLD